MYMYVKKNSWLYVHALSPRSTKYMTVHVLYLQVHNPFTVFRLVDCRPWSWSIFYDSLLAVDSTCILQCRVGACGVRPMKSRQYQYYYVGRKRAGFLLCSLPLQSLRDRECDHTATASMLQFCLLKLWLYIVSVCFSRDVRVL